jgi:large subunit ribosomal protein L9
MKVLLREDVEHLGYAGEVRKVAPGYGRNYLLPRGLAELATPSAMRQAETWRSRAEARRAQRKAEFELLASKIQGVSLEFVAKAGSTGKLYGSVTAAQIAQALNDKVGTELDRHLIETDGLRLIGEYEISLRLDKDHIPTFNVVIKAEGAEEPVAVAEESADTELANAIAETLAEG